ncbi:MAG: tetratricopeptide repeat protein [Anaerolineales bacterium]|nr:tetratricopeptide repeat protein [Anaerolineales bacterium]
MALTRKGALAGERNGDGFGSLTWRSQSCKIDEVSRLLYHPAMRRRAFGTGFLIIFSILSTLACNLPEAMGLIATATPTVTPTVTATPSPTPTPTPEPGVHLDTGDKALFNGEWDRALNAYQSAHAQSNDPNERARAKLGIGRTLMQAGRNEEAIGALSEYLTLYTEHEAYGRGFYLRARVYEAVDRNSEAEQDYQMYLNLRPGLIDAHVHELRGDVLVELKDYSGAILAYQAALKAPKLGDGLGIEIKIAQSHAESGDFTSALAQYAEIYEKTSNEFVRAQMDYLMGLAYAQQGQFDQAYRRYLDAVENYPKAYDSYAGLVILVQDGITVNELDRGLVDYYAGQFGVALAAFDRYLSIFPADHDGMVHYFRGLTLRALGNYQEAVLEWSGLIGDHPEDLYWDSAWEEKAYTQWAYLDQHSQAVQTLLDFVAVVPNHPRAAEFLFDAGLVSERDGELEQATRIWQRVADEYPSSTWTYRALFLAGISRYRLGSLDLAIETFQRALGHVNATDERAAAYLWIGKTKQALADDEAAQAAFQMAADADPGGYYSLRADELAAGRAPFRSPGVYSFEADLEAAQREAEDWLRSTFIISGPEPLSALSTALASDPRLIRGDEFWALGLYEEARDEFEALRMAYEEDAEATYRLMHKYLELGLYRSAIYASRQIMRLAGMEEAATRFAPWYLRYVRFGPYFGELILPQALAHDFDGLFLLSVIRQESLFEGFATSYAAARGLMQIIPSTGLYLADQLGWPPGYTQDDLYRPVVSVRLGSQYLADQRDFFDGDLYVALSAYNAGPGNAAIWNALAPDDPDLYLEVVRFSQPREYIRVIFWAYSHYRDLYASP